MVSPRFEVKGEETAAGTRWIGRRAIGLEPFEGDELGRLLCEVWTGGNMRSEFDGGDAPDTARIRAVIGGVDVGPGAVCGRADLVRFLA